MAELCWNVQKGSSGKIVRRKIEGDELGLDHIDVEWTCDNGSFPPDTKTIPISHPPNIEYKTVVDNQRDVIKDQLSVSPNVSDTTVALMLDEKRVNLSKTLKLS